MVAKKFIELLQKIEEKTARGEVVWEATAEDSVFQATLGSFIIRISEERGEGGPDYRLAVLDMNGRLVDSASNLDFRRVEGLGEFVPYPVLKGIFEGARRTAMGADRAIDSILSELDAGLQIVRAEYGAGNNLKDVTKLLAGKIANERLTVVVNNENLGGDPIPGAEKQLIVTFTHSGQTLSKTGKEHTTLTLP